MPKYISTLGKASLAIGICGRCSRKFPLVELMSDANFPGLRVCRDDLDQYDPYRLPARQTEDVSLKYARPDEPV